MIARFGRLATRFGLLSDSTLLLAGQLVAAVGVLVGIRLLTAVANPALFGKLSLVVGAAALINQLVGFPIGQAAMRRYVSVDGATRGRRLHVATYLELISWAIPAGAAATGLCVAGVAFGVLTLPETVLAALLAGIEVVRTVELSFLSVGRRHFAYATWTAFDAWTRPCFASLLCARISPSLFWLLCGYCAAAAVPLSIRVSRLVTAESLTKLRSVKGLAQLAVDTRSTRRSLRDFALPVVPQAFATSFVGLGDRYVLAMSTSVSEVGMYAAAYGLASRPFTMAQVAIEQATRPHYYQFIERGLSGSAAALYRRYMFSVGATGVVLFLGCSLLSTQIVSLLLDSRFAGASQLLPWIAAGHLLQFVSLVVYTRLFAENEPKSVAASRLFGMSVAVVALLVLASKWGALGAAMACPLYFGAEAVVALVIVRRIRTTSSPLSKTMEPALTGSGESR